jgi:hypothetical protein
MPTIPFRELGRIGVITDVNDVDLPIGAVSDARNVRFSDGRITNAHVWREALASPSAGTPVFTFSVESASDFDILGYVSSDGRAVHVYNGAETEVTPVGYVAAESVAVRSFCALQGLYYLNQEDRVPWVYDSGSGDYEDLANWDSNHRCKVLRGFKDYLIALNITKTATVYTNMVKWSDIAQFQTIPSSWDPSDTTKSAGENTLSEIKTEILDGLQLRNSFMVYAADQVWNMEETGGPDVFNFYKTFGDRGIINTNCVVEVDGVHFVFDDDDIYMHDGVSPPKSICEGKVRKRIFRNLDLTKRTKFFVLHDRPASEVWFCYNSKNSDLLWTGEDLAYCNVAAVYNYIADTWTFFDLPNVSSMTSVSWQTSPTYADLAVETYADMGGTYADLIANTTRSTFAASVLDADVGITVTRFLNADSGLGISLGFAAVAELEVTPFAQRTGLDLDEAIPEIRTYKNYRSVYPQVTTDSQGISMSFKFGGVDMPSQSLEWDALQTFDPYTDYKVDTRSRGRYLAWYFTAENSNTYSFSGFDLDLAAVSRR